MVLQALVGDVQVLVLCPVTPFTYHVPAEAGELIRHKAVSSPAIIGPVCFTIVSFHRASFREPLGRKVTRGLAQQQLQSTDAITCRGRVLNSRAPQKRKVGIRVRTQAGKGLCPVGLPSVNRVVEYVAILQVMVDKNRRSHKLALLFRFSEDQ